MSNTSALCPNCNAVVILPRIIQANQGAILVAGASYTVVCPKCGERYRFSVQVAHLVNGGEK